MNIIYDFSCDLTKETYATVEKFVNANNTTDQYVNKKVLYGEFIKKLSNIKFNSLKQNEINNSITNLIFAFENDVLSEFRVKLDGNIKKLETIRIELDKCLKCFNNFSNRNSDDKRIIDKGGYIQSSFNVLTALIVKLLETMKSRQQCVMFVADFIDIHKYMK